MMFFSSRSGFSHAEHRLCGMSPENINRQMPTGPEGMQRQQPGLRGIPQRMLNEPNLQPRDVAWGPMVRSQADQRIGGQTPGRILGIMGRDIRADEMETLDREGILYPATRQGRGFQRRVDTVVPQMRAQYQMPYSPPPMYGPRANLNPYVSRGPATGPQYFPGTPSASTPPPRPTPLSRTRASSTPARDDGRPPNVDPPVRRVGERPVERRPGRAPDPIRRGEPVKRVEPVRREEARRPAEPRKGPLEEIIHKGPPAKPRGTPPGKKIETKGIDPTKDTRPKKPYDGDLDEYRARLWKAGIVKNPYDIKPGDVDFKESRTLQHLSTVSVELSLLENMGKKPIPIDYAQGMYERIEKINNYMNLANLSYQTDERDGVSAGLLEHNGNTMVQLRARLANLPTIPFKLKIDEEDGKDVCIDMNLQSSNSFISITQETRDRLRANTAKYLQELKDITYDKDTKKYKVLNGALIKKTVERLCETATQMLRLDEKFTGNLNMDFAEGFPTYCNINDQWYSIRFIRSDRSTATNTHLTMEKIDSPERERQKAVSDKQENQIDALDYTIKQRVETLKTRFDGKKDVDLKMVEGLVAEMDGKLQSILKLEPTYMAFITGISKVIEFTDKSGTRHSVFLDAGLAIKAGEPQPKKYSIL